MSANQPSDPSAPARIGKIVFVGNIPYGLTEEQITEIFASAGRVISFRLVYDRETGRPKGFGFAEYPDPETAASAVRNLDNYEIMGRKLRVDFSHEGNATPDDDSTMPNPNTPHHAPPPQQPQQLPPGADIPPGLNAPDAISQTLKQLPVPQLLDILAQMKSLVATDPLKATELLRQAPQLSYAVFQALLLMNLVDTSVLTQVIESAAPVVQAPPPPVVQPQVDPQRQALLQQVMGLSNEQIAALPVEQQQQIMMLRQQVLQGGAV